MMVIGVDSRLVALTGAESIILFTPFFGAVFRTRGAVHAGELGFDATFAKCAPSSTPCWC